MSQHQYEIQLKWTGNRGSGTMDYRAYARDHEITAPLKRITIPGSSDPAFRGEPNRYNPEELLVASLSACHMLWYLHLCAVNEVVVLQYSDAASGQMSAEKGAVGRFTKVVLAPSITVAKAEMVEKATALHAEAHRLCFIANSVNFPVEHSPTIIAEE